MIRGRVFGLQARIGVVFRTRGKQDMEIECVVDTGFEGALTLPREAIELLGLPYLTELAANLADDSEVKADVYVATIVWRGREVEAATLAMGRRPLIGAALMDRHHLGIDFKNNGLVTIDELANWHG